jgi:hypothetical protein
MKEVALLWSVVRSVLLFLVMGVSLDTALCGAVCKDNACRGASNAAVQSRPKQVKAGAKRTGKGT